MTKPVLIMLVGLPGSGKSTFLEHLKTSYSVLSTDNYIEERASQRNLTYDEAFTLYIKEANKVVMADLTLRSSNIESLIILDQTNLTRESRKRKMDMLINRNEYNKICYYFPIDHLSTEQWQTRLRRYGKTIPQTTLDDMLQRIEPPSKEEGFDYVYTIQT